MQVANEELKYQQAVLRHLGFYKGKIDGIWSADSIDAKKRFEFTREFAPAIPNNGLPFATSDRLPKGMHFKRVKNHTVLFHIKLTDEEMQRIVGNDQQTVAVREPVVSNDGPVIEEPVTPAVVEPVEAVSETPIQQTAAPAPQNNQQRHPQHPHKPQHGQRR